MIPRRTVSTVLAVVAALWLAACGGGGGSRSALPGALPNAGPTTAPSSYNGPLADATFKITIPAPATSSGTRRPAYVSSSTTKIVFTLNSDTVGLSGAALTTFNTANLGAKAVTLNSTQCPGTGPWTCTIPIKLPPGTDNLTVSAQDASSHILSQQIQTLTVVAAQANSFSMTLDANITTPSGSMTVNGSGSCQNGPVGTAFGSVGSSPITFTVAYTDAAGQTIRAPGLPKLEIQDNVGTYQTASGTINGTGGTVGFTINQATQSFVLTPSNSSTTNASINVKAIQADTNVPVDGNADGLSFSKTKTFTFSTGVAPPAHNFLGAVEQTGAGSGQVDFFDVTLGGSGGPDSFAAFSPATLAVTGSTNEPGKFDVDNPESLVWDATGDLLIGNANDGGVNHGNMACVPVGAIATGASSSTTVSTNVSSPVGIAYDSRDGSVALANLQPGSTYNLSEYLLTGNYTAAGASRNMKVNLPNLGSNAVVNITAAGLSNGTYAIALTDGGETDSTHNGSTTHYSKIGILSPDGTQTIIEASTGTATSPTAFAIDNPTALAWDSTNNQLVIANGSIWHKQMSFYTISGSGSSLVVAQTKVIAVPSKQFKVATSPDGHVAVQYNDPIGSGAPLIQVYDNTLLRSAVGGPIPYNSVSDGAGSCSTYIYGPIGTFSVDALVWLSNSKLLVAFEDNGDNTKNGLYIYDISSLVVPTGQDDGTCVGYAAAPKQTAFQHLTNRPFAAAFKP
jgi:hypothetical protein